MTTPKNLAQEIAKVGGQYAMTSRYRHPSVAPFIEGKGGGRNVFTVEKVAEVLQSTLSFVEECGEKGQIILFIATRQESVDLVRKTAEHLSLPYMLNRWIGGTLSNFKNIRGRVNKLDQLRKDKESGVWTKYTKKEKVLLNRELTKLENKFGGIFSLESPPNAVFILDTKKERIAVEEANGAEIPIIGFSSANADLHRIQYPIIANIHSRDAVAYILDLVEQSYQKGVAQKKEVSVAQGDSVAEGKGGNTAVLAKERGMLSSKE